MSTQIRGLPFTIYPLGRDGRQKIREPQDVEKDDIFVCVMNLTGKEISGVTMERCEIYCADGYDDNTPVPGVLIKTPNDGNFLMVPMGMQITEKTRVCAIE